MQVEARLRQLEGRSLASDSAKPKGKQQPAAYNAAAEQAGNAGLVASSGAKAYNAAADVVPVSSSDFICQHSGVRWVWWHGADLQSRLQLSVLACVHGGRCCFHQKQAGTAVVS